MSFSMYFNYLIPILIWGYLIVNTNLMLGYFNMDTKIESFKSAEIQVRSVLQEVAYIKVIEGGSPKGLTMLTIGKVLWFEVQNKAYYAHLTDEVYSVRKTITELDNELDPEMFFRINRSQIINLHYVQSYSYWEFEKYIVRLTGIDQKDFIITRKRFKELKEKIEMMKSQA